MDAHCFRKDNPCLLWTPAESPLLLSVLTVINPSLSAGCLQHPSLVPSACRHCPRRLHLQEGEPGRGSFIKWEISFSCKFWKQHCNYRHLIGCFCARNLERDAFGQNEGSRKASLGQIEHDNHFHTIFDKIQYD